MKQNYLYIFFLIYALGCTSQKYSTLQLNSHTNIRQSVSFVEQSHPFPLKSRDWATFDSLLRLSDHDNLLIKSQDTIALILHKIDQAKVKKMPTNWETLFAIPSPLNPGYRLIRQRRFRNDTVYIGCYLRYDLPNMLIINGRCWLIKRDDALSLADLLNNLSNKK